MGLTEIKKLIQEHGIHTVEIGFADIPGVLRGKRISVRYFLDNAEQGFYLSNGSCQNIRPSFGSGRQQGI